MLSSPDDEPSNESINRVSGLPISALLYLGGEILIALLINFSLTILDYLKRLLPKPPRDLRNDSVVVTGAGSGIGKAVADEFLRAGCLVACIDDDENCFGSTEEVVDPCIKRIVRKDAMEELVSRDSLYRYKCDSSKRNDIIKVAQDIRKEIGQIDVLVTCSKNSSTDILDSVSKNLISHYWAMLAFVPSITRSKQGNVVTVIPNSSRDDAYIGTKAAIAGLVEAMAEEMSSANRLTFITATPETSGTGKFEEQKIARDIVNAVRRNQHSISTYWGYKILYSLGVTIRKIITDFNRWMYIEQNCDNSYLTND